MQCVWGSRLLRNVKKAAVSITGIVLLMKVQAVLTTEGTERTETCYAQKTSDG